MSKVNIKSFLKGGRVLCPLFLIFTSLNSLSQFTGHPFLNELSKEKSNETSNTALIYEAYIDSASNFASHQRWEEAERCTLMALKINPGSQSNWLLWANLGELRIRKGDTAGAIEAYTIGLSRNSDSPKMLTGRASVYLMENRNDEALDDINHILSIDEKAEWPRMIRGYMLFAKGNMNEAENDFKKIIEFHPESAAGYEGMVRICSSREDLKEALLYCEKALEKSENEDLWYLKISLLADNEKLSEASEALREAMRKYPRNGNLFLLRAYIHKLSFRNEEMEIDMKLAKEYGADPHLIEKIGQKKTH